MTRAKRGFTLIEIMIVVAIIGILIAVAVPGFIRSRERARVTACQENLIRIDQAIQQYVIQENVQGQFVLTIPLSYLVGEENYLRNMPECPSGGTYTLHAPDDQEPVTCTFQTRTPYPHALPWRPEGS
ncbi:MAG: type pilus assembly protein PilA [Candidatus Sumerlaeota bacterium]|nr:type pilus assembly protein PilA [Candidatus Sumerlaeota bacterium]